MFLLEELLTCSSVSKWKKFDFNYSAVPGNTDAPSIEDIEISWGLGVGLNDQHT